MALLLPHRPAEPFTGPLRVEIRWRFPYRKTERGGVIKRGWAIPHDTRPDLDNLAKGLLDAMTRLQFWRDDAQIYSLELNKNRGPEPQIKVRLSEYDTGGGDENI
jgi:Holliday junction resolvase RusA-like endonuclease